MPTVISSPAAIADHVGQTLGVTDWITVDQDRVNQFADATGDHQWIHVDVERAKNGPFGGTIAHGYLTLSMLPEMIAGAVDVQNVEAALNYGLNKVRFPSPVPVGSRLRGTVVVTSAETKRAGVEAVYTIAVELDGGSRPACVAECVVLYR
ncbi:MaoC family dehydratase [Gordonia spumicola]|uniref:MaoC family dehydratase n=1 Tax=Gordonia spumicola TaxID=589161 RepID=A0A7I9VBF2_9ACTN|nr:MaoC family dehydratase [Gordonia spumicola]GEE02532.1 MaoC family dehydratase [Gordonia spumicola]